MSKKLLKDYHKKRDFKKTKEPSGKKKAKRKSKKLIFVVQEHHARRLHYDFRLELEGVLKSWAVPKGPSLDPSIKRLAVQTEDHPLEYAKFHGTIPQGEYGGGEVFIWDKGTWEPEDEDPIKALEKGHLKFKVKGKRLNGSFVLVRTRYKGSDSKKNWLLIKHKDEKAVLESSDPWPGFISPQLPRLVESVPDENQEWIHEIKFDGYRMQCHLENGLGRFLSRNALDWSNKFPHLLNALESLDLSNAIIDGEVVAVNEKGVSDFQKLQNSLKSKDDKYLRYHAFDLLYLNGKDLRSLPLIERKKLLSKLLKGAPKFIIYSDHIQEDAENFYKASCEHKLEGIVSKLADSPYKSGRNELWVKTKCTNRQEFVIGGWTEPQGGRTGIGALLLGFYKGNDFVYAGRVGTGFNTKMLKDLKKELAPLEVDESPFTHNSPKSKGIHWAEPEKVCEVSFSNWTNEGILRTPVFIALREDKPAGEIHRDKAKKKISSPDKILFSEDKRTKQDVSDYYKEVAPYMLPYISGRPLSLVRCPEGADKTCFYQKHVSGKSIPKSFHTFPVKEEKGEGIYLSIDSEDGLQDLVQLNAFELHGWNCQWQEYMRPDQIVMDFDPGDGVPWKQVVDAAFELKELLEDLDLKSFVKVTGGKGIHVHIPVAPLYDWDQIKSFAQTLALELVERYPDKFTSNMSKKLRKNKIFIDYLRNGYGATAVLPYSLRAKSKSSVAMPLEWSELRRIKSSDQFDIKKAVRKIKTRKNDPWKEMLSMQQKIEILKPVDKKSKKAA